MPSNKRSVDQQLLSLAQEWADNSAETGLRPSTLKQYRQALSLLRDAGIRTVADATPQAVRAFMRARVASGRSPETCNRNLAALTSLVSWLHTQGRVDLAHLFELRQLYLPRRAPPAPDFLSREQYQRLREVAREIDLRFDLLVAFGVEAGLRRHEALMLRREDLAIDVARPFVRVSRTHGRRNKTDRARTAPIRVVFARELLGRDLNEGPVFAARSRRGETLLSPYLHGGTFREWRTAALPSIGDWDWHTLRHTYASWHIQAGVSVAKVAAWLGNSVEICMRHYASVLPGGDEECERAFAACPEVAAPTRPSDPTCSIEAALQVWQREADLAQESKKKYTASVRALAKSGIRMLGDLTVGGVRAYLTARRAEGVSSERRAQQLSEVRSFVGWLERHGQMPVGRAGELKKARV